jgi:arylformamidase
LDRCIVGLAPRSGCRVVDLSFVLFEGMPVWVGQPGFLCERVMSVPGDDYTLHVVRRLSTHQGTHVDAPLHFVAGGRGVDELGVESFVGEGVVVDLSGKGPGEEITVADIQEYVPVIRKGDVVLLHTGWDKRAGSGDDYLFEYPYLVEESARFLAGLGIRALGVDTLSVAGWDGTAPHGPVARAGSPAETHRILLREGVILVEVLRNLGVVLDGERSRRGFFVFAPVTIRGAEAGPCRALAFV